MTVEGKRGTVTKSFKHLKVEITLKEEHDKLTNSKKRYIEINSYLASYKNSAILYTVGSHIKNMIVGVTRVILKYNSGFPI